jgi:hypothetical protein
MGIILAVMKTGAPPNYWFGMLFLAIGVAMMGWMAFDQAGLNVPLWVGEVAAATFALAGASIMLRALGHDRLAKALGIGVVYCLLVPGLWIAFGSDGSGCSVSASLPFGWLSDLTEALSCRIAFGIGALVALAIAIAMTYAMLRPAAGTSDD